MWHKQYFTGLLMGMFLFLPGLINAQEIVNLVFVGENGITENIKEAHSFIVVKHYPNGDFERLDYKMSGPLSKLRTYSDSTLTVLNGRSFEYNKDGHLNAKGYYANNQKIDEWDLLNDTGKVIKTELYENGVLVNPDVKDTVKRDTTTYGDEREAKFKNGNKDWVKYIQENLDQEAGGRSLKGGRVMVRFVVNKLGKTSNIYLERSVEFVLDEAAIKVIRDSPLWTPAFQHGKTLNAYRRQPLTFIKE